LDTQAQITMAQGSLAEATVQSAAAVDMADRVHNTKATVDALLTHGRARAAQGELDAALAAYERAGTLAKEAGAPSLIRKALREWADVLATAGRHEEAFAVMREALSVV
jgi:tetratricopeptide (TPR) repeat protein